MPISGSIDCTLISKGKLFKGKKINAEGKIPQYVNVILIETPNDKFNDFMIVEALTKDEKARGMRQGKKLGNGKFFGSSKGDQQNTYTPPPETNPYDYL
jgi:hypothetical protein